MCKQLVAVVVLLGVVQAVGCTAVHRSCVPSKSREARIGRAFADAVYEFGGADEDLDRFLTDEQLSSRVARFVGTKRFTLTVDYSKSREDMIAAGHYDNVSRVFEGSASHFEISGLGVATVKVELTHFDITLTYKDVLSLLDRRGLRPATFAELLAFGAQYPNEQRLRPIVALGTPVSAAAIFDKVGDVDFLVPYLNGNELFRSLDFRMVTTTKYDRLDFEWWDQFLAVRK